MRVVEFLRELLRLRRQSDKAKLGLLLYLLAAYLGVLAAGDAVAFVKAAREPAEYVLLPGSSGAVLSAQLDALCQLDGVAGLSPNSLNAEAYIVRCRGADLSGVTLHHIEALGFALKDPDAAALQKSGTSLLLTRLGYRALSCVLAALAGSFSISPLFKRA